MNKASFEDQVGVVSTHRPQTALTLRGRERRPPNIMELDLDKIEICRQLPPRELHDVPLTPFAVGVE